MATRYKIAIVEGTQTLTNKTLTSPAINNGVFTGGGALLSKVITATRDLAAASGDVAYTGVGFTPTSIQCITTIEGGVMSSWGFADSSKTNQLLQKNINGNFYSVANIPNSLVKLEPASGASQGCIVKSFDADGFTLTWTKTNSPTGTGTLIFMCFR